MLNLRTCRSEKVCHSKALSYWFAVGAQAPVVCPKLLLTPLHPAQSSPSPKQPAAQKGRSPTLQKAPSGRDKPWALGTALASVKPRFSHQVEFRFPMRLCGNPGHLRCASETSQGSQGAGSQADQSSARVNLHSFTFYLLFTLGLNITFHIKPCCHEREERKKKERRKEAGKLENHLSK